MLDEYKGLYELQLVAEEKLKKAKAEVEKNLKKLERDSKKKDGKLKELNDLREKLRVAEAKIDEYQIDTDKTYADMAVQTAQLKVSSREQQTDMTYSNIESLEKNLNSARMEKSKFLNVVKNFEAQGYSPESGSKSPIKQIQGDTSDMDFTQFEEIGESVEIDYAAINEQNKKVEIEKKKKVQEEKQKKREEVFRKKITEKKKTKEDTAYHSLQQYQQQKESKNTPTIPEFPMNTNENEDLLENKTPVNASKQDFFNNIDSGTQSKDASPLMSPLELRQVQEFGKTNIDTMHVADDMKSFPKTPTNNSNFNASKPSTSHGNQPLRTSSDGQSIRKPIQVVNNKENDLSKLTKMLPGSKTSDQNRNMSSSLINESAEDSYTKDVITRQSLPPQNHEVTPKNEYFNEYGIQEEIKEEQNADMQNNDAIMNTNPNSRIGSPSSIDQTMRQNYMHSYRERKAKNNIRDINRTAIPSTKNNTGSKFCIFDYDQTIYIASIQVKGKASIKNLIRVAATRK